MESREEIEAMRVADLKQFLKLHGQLPTVVTRNDGTPGPPRKADLLRAALAIESAHRTQNFESLQQDPTLSPYSPHINRNAKPNAFQSRLPSPAQPPATTETPPPPTTPQSRQRDDNAAPARIPTPGRVTNRKRRSSGVWIDPMLLRPSVNVTPAEKTKSRESTKHLSKQSKRASLSVPNNPPSVVEVPILEAVLPDDDAEDTDYGASGEDLMDDTDLDEGVADRELFDQGAFLDVRGLEEDRGDVLVHSDVEHVPDARQEIDEEIEEEGEQFQRWGTQDLKRWLDQFGVRYGRRAGRSELVSLARAHALQMEMEAEARENEKQKRKKERRHRRRRVITAPVEDEEESVRKGAPRRDAERKQSRLASIGMAISRKWANVRISWTFVVGAMGLLLGVMIIWSLINVYRNHTKPFCDTGKTTTPVEDGYGCRKCPNLGICESGALSCEEGYVVMGKICVEDQESSIMAEEIAQEANTLLGHQAGSAECGDIESGILREAEIREAVKLMMADRPSGGLFSWSGRTFHADKFDHAFEKALVRLMDSEDFPDVVVTDVGEYKSLSPIHSFSCRIKLFLWRQWKAVAGLVGLIGVWLYVKAWLFLKRKDQEKLDLAHGQALELLREQKANYVRNEEEFAFMSDVVLRQEVLGYPSDEVVRFWKRVEELLQKDNRLAYKTKQVVKGVPSNTYEWRSRVSTNRLLDSGGSLRSFDSPMSSAGRDLGAFGTPAAERDSWLGAVQRRLFNTGT
eukprot:GFKZ01005540.1.p1 GENE.GFKZ01005540.1~~GFKZ01005540.1.p1  ORF type:complete len:828 (+),score=105.18 GFKZ01005540.1:258-2486(+)